MSNLNKPIIQQIDAYIKGKLSEDEISELWVEFAKNPDLLVELEVEVGLKELLQNEMSSHTVQKKARINNLQGWIWTAAAAAVLLMVSFVQLFQKPSLTSLDELVLTHIQPDQLETADGIRAKEMAIYDADSILNLGFNAVVNGRVEQALMLYTQVIEEYDFEPYGSKAHLNIGIIQYNQGEYDLAIVSLKAALDRVEDSRMIEEKAYWFLGNALVNTGELHQARVAVFEAYRLDGLFRTPAFLLLQKLNYDLGYEDTESGE